MEKDLHNHPAASMTPVPGAEVVERLRRLAAQIARVPAALILELDRERGELKGGRPTLEDWASGRERSLAQFLCQYLVTAGDLAASVLAEIELRQYIAEQQKAKEALEIRANWNQALFESALDAVIVLDDSRRCVAANPAAGRLLGLSQDELVGKRLDDLFEPGLLSALNASWESLLQEGQQKGEFRARRRDGSGLDLEYSAKAGFIPGHHVYFLRDVTARKRADAALRESEERFRSLCACAPVGIFLMTNSGSCYYINRICHTILGDAGEKSGSDSTRFDKCKSILEQWASSLSPDREDSGDFRFETQEGVARLVHVRMCPMVSDRGKMIGRLGIAEDITERRRAEIQLRMRAKQQAAMATFSRQALELPDCGKLMEQAAVLVAETLEVEYSRVLELLPGGNALLLRAGVGWRDGCIGNVTIPAAEGTHAGFTLRSSEPVRIEDLRAVSFSVHPLFIDHGVTSVAEVVIRGNGRLFGILGADSVRKRRFEDDDLQFLQSIANVLATAITRSRSSAQFHTALRQKELLLREIHHRVKNNLQIVSSLLSIQARHIKDDEARKIYLDSQNRIKAMAMIHTALYQSKDQLEIDFPDYIRTLAETLVQSYGVGRDIKLQLHVDRLRLGIDAAVPCGLIINELVSNSLKHAFPPGARGEIRIDMHAAGNRITLEVSDNGIGLPPDVDLEKTKSFGLELVKTLADQLEAGVEVERNGGTRFRLTFREPQKSAVRPPEEMVA